MINKACIEQTFNVSLHFINHLPMDENMQFNERLKFYADTPMEKNKYFCYKITSILELKAALWRFFDKGWNIRSAWYEKINTGDGSIENQRLNVPDLLTEYCNQKFKK
jgi:hypothetical protein